ncbi:MAG TPA: heavy metal translocating P-type ATPase [Alphaproteobacteria bacterium]|nr:heavy metal translocating P-type ATPase [Alphaproteobacteria bacterium]
MSVAAQLLAAIPSRAPAAVTCAHCGAALAADCGRFCCAGCAAAYALVCDLGLDRFYRSRTAPDGALRPDPAAPIVDYAAYATADAAGHSVLHLMVEGITCAACVWLIETVLAREPGIIEARVNVATRRLVVRWAGPAADAHRHVERLAALGFRLIPFDPQRLVMAEQGAERELLKSMAVAGFAAGNVMLLSVSVWAGENGEMGPATRDLLHWVSALIALPAIAYAGRPFFRSALTAVKAGRTNMDVPISIGVLLAAGMSLFETFASGVTTYFDSAVTLLFFLLAGRYLDLRARGRARAAAENLLTLAARSVNVLAVDGSVRAVLPQAVASGATVLVAAGERFGVDGHIVEGRSDLDTSLVTGETVPAMAGPGTAVFAGTVNLTAPVRMTVTATGEGTLLAEIVRLMEAAAQGRGRFVALADRVARAYAPLVHALAALTFLGWYGFGGVSAHDALLTAIAVLIITCPCALGLAVPVVQIVASGRLLRGGTLLKSATALERLADIDTVVFDKTGTLTVGRPELSQDRMRSGEDLRLAASIAASSRHPLARALQRACPGVEALGGVAEHPGRGLSAAEGHGEIRLGSRAFCGISADEAVPGGPELWLARPGHPPVQFMFTDALRCDAAEIIQDLRRRGLDVRLMSGDRAAVVAGVARRVGLDLWQAECTPARKAAELAALRAHGRRVLMVGDGLNDAPALEAADVSASPATAADICQTAADLVFQGDRLAPVLEALDMAKRTRRLVRQNLVLALAYNLAAVPLAILGYVTPLIAAVAMSSSSVIVIGNALRLGRPGRAP